MASGYKKLAVISKYKETEKFWYKTVKEHGYKMMLFNKYQGRNLLPNVGREGHTYLYFIVNNYYNLPDEILFSQYNPKDHFRAMSIFETKERNVNWNRFLNGKLYDFIGIRPTDFDYEVRKRNIDWIDYCKIIFPEFTQKDINQLIFCGSNLNGVFRVSKKAILRRSKQFYEKCLDLLSHEADPDSGYFFERIWKYIFVRYGCIDNNYRFLENQLLLFGTDKFNTINSSGGVNSSKAWKQNAYGHIFLHESGCLLYNTNRISLYAHPNETYWLIEDGKLFIFDAEGSIRHQFLLKNILANNLVVGDFFDTNGKRHKKSHWLKPSMFQSRFSFENLDKADPIT